MTTENENATVIGNCPKCGLTGSIAQTMRRNAGTSLPATMARHPPDALVSVRCACGEPYEFKASALRKAALDSLKK